MLYFSVILKQRFYYLSRRKNRPKFDENVCPDLSGRKLTSLQKQWWDLNKKSKNMEDAVYDRYKYSVNKKMVYTDLPSIGLSYIGPGSIPSKQGKRHEGCFQGMT